MKNGCGWERDEREPKRLKFFGSHQINQLG